MKYFNPIILSDYSDPDVIRVGEDFYMIASSFNHVPAVPILHSKNLVEWELISHIARSIPFPAFSKVEHGHGAWAPSIRYHGGKFYALIPFPDEGIYVSETEDIYGEWSPLRPLLKGAGYEDPCPIWIGDKCYVMFAFVRSRIGFNSRLAVFEADVGLNSRLTDYKIVYNGSDIAPWIEGPKLYSHGGYIYVLAPAGGVATGWQVALRTRDIYGDYETKIVMVQGDSKVNGPHQGALVDLDDGGERWAFLHFQKFPPFGRIVHLQPAIWRNDWVICGKESYDNLAGSPVTCGDYPIDISTGYKIDPSDSFKGGISRVWQTPANLQNGWFSCGDGLTVNCTMYPKTALSDVPQLLLQKIQYLNFNVKTACFLNLIENGDETGFTVFGRSYAYVCIVRRNDKLFAEYRTGKIGGDTDEIVISQPYDGGNAAFGLKARYNAGNLLCKFTLNGKSFGKAFYAQEGVWVGAKMGVYALSRTQSKGFARFTGFSVKEVR